MAQQNFIESDLNFSFDLYWVVKKYDEHAYFKTLSGYGLKGVDFIGVYKEEHLYLIEVKNYQQREYSPVPANWIDIEGEMPPLVTAFNRKIDDTYKLIRVVNAYLNRKWWFYIFSWVQNLIENQKLNKDWKFWKKVYELSNQPSNVSKVLWLELDADFLEKENYREPEFIERISNLILTQSNYANDSVSVLSMDHSLVGVPGLNVYPINKKR